MLALGALLAAALPGDAAAAAAGADGLGADAPGPDDFEADHYMTEEKARKIVDEPLPESQHDIDQRLQVIRGTALMQLERIDKLIPLALLGENGDVTAAEVVAGVKSTKPVTLLDCHKKIEKFALKKAQELDSIANDTKKMKGTIVDFQLIDDMANDPGHPWIHSATYNKTSVSRKLDAVAKLFESWVVSMNKNIETAGNEYLAPFNYSLAKVPLEDRPPPAAMAWIEGYMQSTRIILVAANLLKKFTAKGMAEGVRLAKHPTALPMNVKDYLEILTLAARKVGERIKRMMHHETEPGKSLHGVASSLIESNTGLVDEHFSAIERAVEELKVAALRERDAMEVGFLPKAAPLLLAYGGLMQALQNANNATRIALDLPPTLLTARKSLGAVYESILHGDLAAAFYGKKLAWNETLPDWGVKATRVDPNGPISFVATSFTESEAQKKMNKLRDIYDKRIAANIAYDTGKTLSIVVPADGVAHKRYEALKKTGQSEAFVDLGEGDNQ